MQSLIALSKKTIQLKRNDFLKLHQTIDTNIYLVESGSLRVYISDNDEEQNIRFAYSSNIIVALDSFLTGKSSPFSIQAIKKSVVNVILKSVFLEFVNKNEANREFYKNILEDLILQQMEREIDLLTDSPFERYSRVLKRSPQVFQEIPHKHIANYLRMSPETLSRIKKS